MSDGTEQQERRRSPSGGAGESGERPWREAFDALSDPVFTHDAEFRIVRANRAYCQLAGLPYPQLLGRRYWEVFPRRDGPTPGCRGGVEGVVDETVDRLLVTAGGRLFRSRNFPVRDAQGRYLESLHLMEDVTERQRLQEERLLLGNALNQVGDGVVILTAELTVRHANPALLRLLEYSEERLSGLSVGAFCPECPRLLLGAGPPEPLRSGETELVGAGGEPIPVRYHLSTTREAVTEQVTGYLFTFSDLRVLRHQYQRLESFARISEEIATLESRDEMGRRAVAAAAHLTGADGAAIALREGEGVCYRWQSGFPAPLRQRLARRPVPGDDDLAAVVIRSGKPRLIREYPRGAAARETLAQYGVRSAAAVPLPNGAGALMVAARSPEHPLTPEHVGTLEALARPLGQALERHRLLSALKASEGRLRRLADAVPDILFELRLPEFELAHVSAGVGHLADFFRYVERVGHRRWLRQIHPDDLSRRAEEVERAVASGDGYAVEYRLLLPGDGAWFWAEERGRIERDGEGRAICIYGAVHDATACKGMESALRESEKRFHFIFDTFSQGILFFDSNGGVMAVNRAAERLLSCRADALVGRHDTAIGLLDEQGAPLPAEARPVARALATGQPIRNVRVGIATSDGARWLQFDAVPRRAPEGGAVDLVYVNLADVTETRRVEMALRASERRFRSLFERAATPMLVIDDEGRYIDANDAALAFLECSREGLPERTIDDYLPAGREGEAVRREHRALWRRGGQLETPYRVNGRTKWLDLTLVPELMGGRAVVFGMGRDITARKRAQATALARLNLLERQQRGAGIPWQSFPLRPLVEEALATVAEMVGALPEVVLDVASDLMVVSNRPHLLHTLVSLLADLIAVAPGGPVTLTARGESEWTTLSIAGVAPALPGAIGGRYLVARIVADVLQGQIEWHPRPEGGGWWLAVPQTGTESMEPNPD